jgi:hypothetical protein
LQAAAQAQFAQQGPKLVGTGAVGHSVQGHSISLSNDGNTAIVGGPFDNNDTGAAWVFTRSGGVWTQQGTKLIGADAVGPFAAEQGYSVSISGDGNTALINGPFDNSFAGAAWVFTRSDGVWTQQAKLVVPARSVALSGDGNTAISVILLTGTPVQLGYSRVRVGCGPSKAPNWSVQMRSGQL